MSRNAWWILGGLFLVAVFGVQLNQINNLKREVAAVRAELSGPLPAADPGRDGPEVIPHVSAAAIRPLSDGTAGVQARLAYLERNRAEIAKGSEVLMNRGVLPPSEERLAQLQQRFFDPSISDEERLKTLSMLRRGNQLSDEMVTQTLSMLQNSTNTNFRRALLQNLDGLTNASLKQPLFAMLQTEGTADVRSQLVSALRRFTDDPAVESKLWDLSMNDPIKQVRDRAKDAVTRGEPVTQACLDSI